VRVYF